MAYSDGDFSKAAANGGKSRVYPFDGDAETYYTEQEFIQNASDFRALRLNALDPTEPLCYLVKETDPQDAGGGLLRWSRVYSRIPKQRNEYETVTYTFPGYSATLASEFQSPFGLITAVLPFITDPGRAPIARKVTSRMQFDYFLVGFNGSYRTVAEIPTVSGQRYTFGTFWEGKSGQDLPDRILYQASLANFSTPTVEAWKALVTAGTEVVVEDSEIRRWRGNIYERMTRYVVAQ
jgi:hypothetical protein